MEDLSHYNPEGSVMRKTQMRLLEMLDVFDAICRKHNINYWLVCGTLLGARRHGGFIPWDDDLDVAILQSDCKKLLSILKEELPDNLKLQTKETDKNYWYFFPRIRDTRSHYYNKKGDIFEHNGIFLDIFLFEPVPSKKFRKIITNFLLSEMNFKKAKSVYRKIKYGIILSFLPIIHLIIKLTRVYYKYISSGKMYGYTYGSFATRIYKVENFYPVSEITFEGKRYKAPGNVDKYLIENFDSNFMVIPEASKRYSHAAKVEFF